MWAKQTIAKQFFPLHRKKGKILSIYFWVKTPDLGQSKGQAKWIEKRFKSENECNFRDLVGSIIGGTLIIKTFNVLPCQEKLARPVGWKQSLNIFDFYSKRKAPSLKFLKQNVKMSVERTNKQFI